MEKWSAIGIIKFSDKIAGVLKYMLHIMHTSGVPQNVFVVPMPSIPSLHSPKSVRVMWPW